MSGYNSAPQIRRSEELRKADACAKEMRQLSKLYDHASEEKKNKIFNKMTKVMNLGMGILEGLHGRRFEPVTLKSVKK